MWLSSQNKEALGIHLITSLGMILCGIIMIACTDINIGQLGQNNQEKLQKIKVVDIESRNGQLFGRELRKLLHIGGKSSDAYELTTTIETASSSTLSVQGAASSLKKMSMSASFQLNDLKTGKPLFAGVVTGDATLGAVTSFYGQDKSELHARERLSILLAQRVVRRLQLYFLRQSQ